MFLCRTLNETLGAQNIGALVHVNSRSDRHPGILILPFTWENQKFQMENQMVSTILFWKVQKIWAVIWDDAIFYSFLVCIAQLIWIKSTLS